MDLIDRDLLLQIIDKAEREYEQNRKFIRCRHFRKIVNKMPSVVPDEPWEANLEALSALYTKE